MPTQLVWRGGKFIYTRNSDVLLHYMPLQEFALETAQNFSLMVALRMHRLGHTQALIERYEIKMWREMLQSAFLANVASALASSGGRVVDFGSYNGLMFEELKLLWSAADQWPSYHIVEPNADYHVVFEGIHHDDAWKYSVVEPAVCAALGPSDTLLLNQSLAIRHDQGVEPPWRDLIRTSCGTILLAIRAAADGSTSMRTTIRGREVLVPSVAEVRTLLAETRRQWYSRWLPRHDQGFFLPQTDAAGVGLLVCYSGPADASAIRDFQPV